MRIKEETIYILTDIEAVTFRYKEQDYGVIYKDTVLGEDSIKMAGRTLDKLIGTPEGTGVYPIVRLTEEEFKQLKI